MNKKPSFWETKQEQLLMDCSLVSGMRIYKRLCAHPDGRQDDFLILKCHDWVQVIPFTEKNELVMVRQFRFASQELSWEFPGGVLHDKEDPIEGGMREFLEETGFVGENPNILGTLYPNPAFQENKVYFVLAENCSFSRDANWDTNEELETKIFSLKDVFEMARIGEIKHSITINCLFFISLYLSKNNINL